jgi:hypothetical protein
MKKVIFINGRKKSSVIIREGDAIMCMKDWKRIAEANMVIVIHMDTGKTEIVKNRWGDCGVVHV